MRQKNCAGTQAKMGGSAYLHEGGAYGWHSMVSVYLLHVSSNYTLL